MSYSDIMSFKDFTESTIRALILDARRVQLVNHDRIVVFDKGFVTETTRMVKDVVMRVDKYENYAVLCAGCDVISLGTFVRIARKYTPLIVDGDRVLVPRPGEV